MICYLRLCLEMHLYTYKYLITWWSWIALILFVCFLAGRSWHNTIWTWTKLVKMEIFIILISSNIGPVYLVFQYFSQITGCGLHRCGIINDHFKLFPIKYKVGSQIVNFYGAFTISQFLCSLIHTLSHLIFTITSVRFI